MDDGKEINYDSFVVDLCGNCRKKCSLKCSQCNTSSYCSIKCQRQDRKQHTHLMQCLDHPTLQLENKIKFGEMLNAQVLLTFAFSGECKFLEISIGRGSYQIFCCQLYLLVFL